MSEYNPLPIFIGITGHRDIPKKNVAGLESRVEELLLSIKKQYPGCPIVVLSSLADGADRLCARAALKTGCSLRVPLPMPREDYATDFAETSLREFDELLSRADDYFVVAPIEPIPSGGTGGEPGGKPAGEPVGKPGSKPVSEPGGEPVATLRRGYLYRQAGLYTAQHAHILIALWDGSETPSPGSGGTYETICFARQENIIIIHIPAPRLSTAIGNIRDCDDDAPATPAIETSDWTRDGQACPATWALPRHGTGKPVPYLDTAQSKATKATKVIKAIKATKTTKATKVIEDARLDTLNNFNREIISDKTKLDAAADRAKTFAIDSQTEKRLDTSLTCLLHTFLYADALSVKYRNLKLLTLRLLSVLGLALVLSFLMYDEMESDLMLFVYGALVISACVIYAISSKGGYHKKYISYRALAEALRVQFYWALGGISANVCDSYTFTQKAELDYVRYIIRSMDIKLTGYTRRDCAYQYWIAGQHEYHTASATAKNSKNQRNIFAARFMLALALLLFAVTLTMELLFKAAIQKEAPINDALRDILIMHDGQVVMLRGVLKIALGAISAGTAFLANYYGGLSLPREIFDNRRMMALFGADLNQDSGAQDSAIIADTRQGEERITDEHMLKLGKESIIESGGWYIAQKENAPGLFIT